MSVTTILTSNEEHILDVIYKFEEQKINIGSYEFFSDTKILKNSSINDLSKLHSVLCSLQEKKLIILINEENEINDDNEIKYLVRSRIGHILWCLQNSKDMHNFNNSEWNANVVDLKYIKYDKMAPKWNQDISQITNESYFKENFDIHAEADLLKGIIESLGKDKLSQFQINSINAILTELSGKYSRTPKGVSIVAGTGTGKSMAYQLPLLIWIVAKKINLIKKFRSVTEAKKYTNCFGLLLFPRNALAKDQHISFNEKIDIVNSVIDSWIGIDSEKKDYLKIKLRKDFGGTVYKEKLKIYKEKETDVIITNTETLKLRLYDPIAHNLFKYGIDLVLYDEIHLYEGLQGSYVSGLNCRLSNLISFSYKKDFSGKPPLFIGMSATIDKPDIHCQKLFGLQEKPLVINDDSDEKIKRSTEHHFILKPRTGRVPLGVAIDATSCLIHNRRDGLQNYHRSGINNEERPKSITFIDSLDGTARFTNFLNDLEWYDLDRSIPVQWPVKKRYPVYHKPLMRDGNSDICDSCVDGTDVQVRSCSLYADGNCWYFSQDTGSQGFWRQKLGGRYNYSVDGIRSKRITSQEISNQKDSDSNYVFFTEKERKIDFANIVDLNEKIDNLISTSVLEVGIDFKKISEIILYGDIKSPASYKQKSGRGAREGNVSDGLCVMSVIYNSPLSNFYFKHFNRLVQPYQSPIKLEVRNPDIIASQCFATVFDFLAANQIELYSVRNSLDEDKVTKDIKEEFDKAKQIINSDPLKNYLCKYLSMLNYPPEQSKIIIDKTIEKIKSLFEQLSEIIIIDGQGKPLIDWLSLSPKNPKTQRALEEQFKNEFEVLNENKISFERTYSQLRKEFYGFKKTIDSLDHTELKKDMLELEELLKK